MSFPEHGFRARLRWTVIGLVVGTVAVVAVTAFLLVRGSLREQLVDDAVDVAEFAIVELATTDQLAIDGDRAAFEESGLAERFARRGVAGVYVDFGDGDPYASNPDLLSTPALTSPGVEELVDRGQYGYQFLEVGGEPRLMVAARRPVGSPEFHLFFDVTVVQQALGDLWRFLAIAGTAVVVVAALAAGWVASGLLRPVGTAAAAARRLAAGDLDTRVPVVSEDELGTMSEAFNTMAASMERQIRALEEAEARERRFVADVSHELRTPLTGLSNAAQLLAPGIDRLDGPPRRAAELLVADVERLRRLVDELLEVSRLEAGVELHPTETDLQRFLGALVANRAPHASLVVEALGPVACDRLGVERVVGNLLDNAAAHAAGSAVEVEATADDRLVVITVCDRGPGVSPEVLDRLFDRFYKVDPSRQGGSGLGLAIALRHARRMGGDLTASLRNGGGLCFRLSVPVTNPLHAGDVDEMEESDAVGVETE